MLSILKRYLIGKPLKTTELGEQKLSNTKALAILSSDALSSVAYGPEQILIVLATVGAVAYWYSIPIGIGVLILLLALILSYRQIIFSYPHGGGAYVVSKQNLGVIPGLVAGGSLLVDYILTVAVSVSAGTDAITSAIPILHSHTVFIAVLLVIFITILNLRGLTESASILAYPVYLFVVALVIIIVVGLFNVITGNGPQVTHSPIGTTIPGGISLFLLLKAFSSGCSALTGVEAISNAIPNFKEPSERNAAKTLTMMGLILAVLFSGIMFLAYWYSITPNAEETVMSQLGSEIFGRNIIYYFIQGTTALILVLAANTGFSAFPLLAYNLASDKFMPRMYLLRGDRLGYSNGIITLGVASILLIIAFQGKTEQLIPLYAVGVFVPFTLSQTGMVIKWLREKPANWFPKMITNLVGALISALVSIIFLTTKFNQVWSILVFLPLIVYLFLTIRKHYEAVGDQLRLNNDIPDKIKGNIMIVPVAGITKVVERTMQYAQGIADEVYAVYISFDKESEQQMRDKWETWNPNVKLIVVHSEYREITRPLLKVIDQMEQKAHENGFEITVLIPQFITKKNWHNVLHNQSSLLLRAYLLHKRSVIVTTVPYRFKV
ncbi:APC family permease [Gottfriedia solisilvae]|uniref:Amino acid permease n=1 Tax=Gottfriedia solisilvae TaxID=1516104 RepID=A0A8J3AMS4_9BACI|nr:APC family permease [Gottfriedia solisilvae]GGI16499.1 amino acid permease [Gottfriedia solisilvae]